MAPEDLNAVCANAERLDAAQRAIPDGMNQSDLMNLGDDGIAERPPRTGLLMRLMGVFKSAQLPNE